MEAGWIEARWRIDRYRHIRWTTDGLRTHANGWRTKGEWVGDL